MKKRTIVVGILAVVLIALVCIILLKPEKNKTEGGDVLSISSKSDLQKYIADNKVEIYSFEKNAAYIGEVSIFNEEAEVEFYMTDNTVDEIAVLFVLFQAGMDEEYENATEVPDEIPIYQFTDADKDKINKAFERIKAGYEKYIGCTFDGYDIVPILSSEGVEDSDENFYSGKYMKEFSVRDVNGILWIMRFEASYGSASVVVNKIIDEAGFDGFIPRVDLTNK